MKKKRLQILKRIINEKEISDQLELQDELKKMGIYTTQATISRDLQELKVVKICLKPGVFKYKAIDMPGENHLKDQLKHLFTTFVHDIKGTSNLLIVKTSIGNANSVAVIIDQIEYKEILGTIAGDDTILIIIDTVKNRESLQKKFQSLLHIDNT